MLVYGLLELGQGLRVSSDALSQNFNIKINGLKAKLKTPSILPDFNLKQYENDRSLGQPLSRLKFAENAVEWGKVNVWPSCESVIKTLLIEFSFRTAIQKNEAEKIIINEFSNWVTRFNHNLYGQNYYLNAITIQSLDDVHKQFHFHTVSKKGKRFNSFAARSEQISVDISASLNKQDLLQLLSYTSNNKTICPEYLFLKDAELAFKEKEYRKSILDSATALEMCLNSHLRRTLKGDKELIEEILKDNNSIYKKRKLMKYSNKSLPEYDYKKEIEELRNKAIHGGRKPTEEEAKSAIKIVKHVLEVIIDEKNKYC